MGFRRLVLGASVTRTLVRGLVLALVLLVLSRWVIVPVRASGISMLPTFHDGQLLLFNALAFRFDDPARGDIVAITFDDGGNAVLVKRIIAVPGERVRIDGGTVFVNDEALPEPYAWKGRSWQVDEFVLDDDEFFVIGDNRTMSARNHTFGIVDREGLRGRLLF